MNLFLKKATLSDKEEMINYYDELKNSNEVDKFEEFASLVKLSEIIYD